jgi:ADP-heptose:LPS heptosyltransferase
VRELEENEAKGLIKDPFGGASRILIVRLSSIGDTVHSLVLADAIKKIKADTYLGWVVEEASSPLIVDNPLLDWCYVVKKGFLKSLKAVLALRRELKKQNFQISFDPQSLSKSALVSFLSGAKKRVGFARPEGRELSLILNNIKVSPTSHHVVLSTLELLNGVGESAPEDTALVLPDILEEDKTRLNNFLKDIGSSMGDYFLFAPGSAQASKRWPLSRYCELASKLFQDIQKNVIYISYDDEERKQIETLIEGKSGQHLSPKGALPWALALIRKSYLTLGSDSFAAHVSTGLKIPTVMLFSVSDPLRVGPLHHSGTSLHKSLTIVRSAKARKKLGPQDIESIKVDDVERAIVELVSKIES